MKERILELRRAGVTVKKMSSELNLSTRYINDTIRDLINEGIVERKKSGRRVGYKSSLETAAEETKQLTYKSKLVGNHRCQYPQCNIKAVYSFSLVTLCSSHYETITLETALYYEKEIEYNERVHFLKIAILIPWSGHAKKGIKKNLKKSGVKGVTYHPSTGAWQAHLYVPKTAEKSSHNKFCGIHDTVPKAKKALEKMRKEMGLKK